MVAIAAMSELDARCIQSFRSWLRSLPGDAELLAQQLDDESLPEDVRRPLAGALNYLFKSLDLIDDGIEGLGYLDDAFVLRVAAGHAGAGVAALAGLREDSALIAEFLGALAPRFERFVVSLRESTVRGRSVDALLRESSVRKELLADVAAWGARYEKPHLSDDDKNLVKLRSFLSAKLPA